MTVNDQTTATHGVELTGVAAGKVKSLLEQEGRDDLRLRIAVQPGGCSGLVYQLYFDERSLDGDLVRDFDGVEVVVDRMSAPYLSGATIDFADTIEKQGFTIDNPNASGSCACGDSFHCSTGGPGRWRRIACAVRRGPAPDDAVHGPRPHRPGSGRFVRHVPAPRRPAAPLRLGGWRGR